jgi:hypothetical protein
MIILDLITIILWFTTHIINVQNLTYYRKKENSIDYSRKEKKIILILDFLFFLKEQ